MAKRKTKPKAEITENVDSVAPEAPGDILGGAKYKIHHGDCIPHMADLPDACMDMAVFSPPFPSLYCYTSLPEDIGNSDDLGHESSIHLAYFYRQLCRVLKPGRIAMVHVTQIPRMRRHGGRGLYDFRGLNIRMAQRCGMVYEYDWLIRKNPQAQAIRTHSHSLLFASLERNRISSRGCLCDFLIKFSALGDNKVPIDQDPITRQQWIDWAEGCWHDIRETDTLNVREGRSEKDTKHICPLQLGLIERCIRLFSNPGEIVFSPFAGIGSEGYCALKLGRRFYGCEIKPEYFACAERNMKRALDSPPSNPMMFLFGDVE